MVWAEKMLHILKYVTTLNKQCFNLSPNLFYKHSISIIVFLSLQEASDVLQLIRQMY